MTTDVTTRPIVDATEKTVRSITDENPKWLAKRRLEAWRAYESLDLPDPGDEEWRRTDVRAIPLALLPVDTGYTANRQDSVETSDIDDDSFIGSPLVAPLAGTIVFDDLEERAIGLKDEVAKQGVVVDMLSQVAFTDRKLEKLVEKLLYSLVPPEEWKYVALNAALWRDGALVYVPDNVEVELPIRTARLSVGHGLAVFPRSLIIVGKHAKLTLIDERHSPDDKKAFVSDVTEIFVGDGAKVQYYNINRWGDDVYNFNTVRAVLGRDAEFTALAAGIGSRLTKMRIDTLMPQPGARAELLGVTFGSGEQHFDYNTLQDHSGDHTVSDLQFKSALTDSASLVWYGITHIRPKAAGSEANQTSRNMLLSDHAKAAPIPVLEIEAYDVTKCSHGATAGPVDENELFYLQTRGIDQPTAERMLVEGFFADVIDRVPDERVRGDVMGAILAKVGGAATERLDADELLASV